MLGGALSFKVLGFGAGSVAYSPENSDFSLCTFSTELGQFRVKNEGAFQPPRLRSCWLLTIQSAARLHRLFFDLVVS